MRPTGVGEPASAEHLGQLQLDRAIVGRLGTRCLALQRLNVVLKVQSPADHEGHLEVRQRFAGHAERLRQGGALEVEQGVVGCRRDRQGHRLARRLDGSSSAVRIEQRAEEGEVVGGAFERLLQQRR